MVKVLDASALMVYLEKEEGYEKVKELLVKAAETDKKLLMAAVNFGEVYYAVAREAEKILLQAAALNPKADKVHYYLGRIYEETGRKEEALKEYRDSQG